MRSSMQS